MWVRHFLVKRLGSLPGMTEALERGITVADVGCGCTPVDASSHMSRKPHALESHISGALSLSAAPSALGAAPCLAISDSHHKSLVEHESGRAAS